MSEPSQPWWTDDDLVVAALADVGRRLDVNAANGPSSAVSTGRRPLLLVAATVLVMAAGIMAIAPVRHVVGGWLRVGPIDVQLDPDATMPTAEATLPAFVSGPQVVPIAPDAVPDERRQALGDAWAASADVSATTLGDPEQWWSVAEGGVLAAWSSGQTTLWMAPLDEMSTIMVDKIVATADSVIELADLGDGTGGVAVAGQHLMRTPYRTVAAGTAVAWTDGPFMYRLESATSSTDDLVDVARALAATVR